MAAGNGIYQTGRLILGETKTVHNSPGGAAMHNDDLAKRAGSKGALVLNEYHFAQMSQMLLAHFGPQWLGQETVAADSNSILCDRRLPMHFDAKLLHPVE